VFGDQIGWHLLSLFGGKTVAQNKRRILRQTKARGSDEGRACSHPVLV
jgi:hypothetical protein